MASLNQRFHSDVFLPYLELLKAQYRFHPFFSHAKTMWEQSLQMDELVNGPFLERAQIYENGDLLKSLPLSSETIKTVEKKLGGRALYRHQSEALRWILEGKNTVIATGTGSGKTLCYQIPILNNLVEDSTPGLRAIIIYPLNALVNDQLTEWEDLLTNYPKIKFARFTGQTPRTQLEYEDRLEQSIRNSLSDSNLTQQELQQQVRQKLQERLRTQTRNRLNHRDSIRQEIPQILITNFSMLEYLMERPIDAPIFEGSNLKFLVLDEAHAYRGTQATEIAFLIRRLKDRLLPKSLVCIATSATLGRQGDVASETRVRLFATSLFGEQFDTHNPIYGKMAIPQLQSPSHTPEPSSYIQAAEMLAQGQLAKSIELMRPNFQSNSLADVLAHDKNLHQLKSKVLTKPSSLKSAAKQLWPSISSAEEGLQALLEIVSHAKSELGEEELMPTRLHYFVKAQDGLHLCLDNECPGRKDGLPAFFVSRKPDPEIPEGLCPDCHSKERLSQLIEVVSCRKCGYLYGALQDLGPKRAQNPDEALPDSKKPSFNSFSTELGWGADSFWSYFSVSNELPYPQQMLSDEEDEDDEEDLLVIPATIQFCIRCGKKKDNGEGDNCRCEHPYLREIKIFHRQCPSNKRENLYSHEKHLLTVCPNCGTRKGSGLEPVRRFQESDDEMGLAMAVPLAHFEMKAVSRPAIRSRKLLCFTDHRQRAAAFPSLLEEETFGHDMGRKLVQLLEQSQHKRLKLVEIGEKLYEATEKYLDEKPNPSYDPEFFLPVSRLPDDMPSNFREKDAIFRLLWIGEALGYFGIPDPARESAEDLGIVNVVYEANHKQRQNFYRGMKGYCDTDTESEALMQILLRFVRQRKAFTLPPGIKPNDPAFGTVGADIGFVLERKGVRNTYGWIPRIKKDGSFNDNYITDLLRRLLSLDAKTSFALASQIWEIFTMQDFLIKDRALPRWKLDHEKLVAVRSTSRYLCDRCTNISSYNLRFRCPKRGCEGKLALHPFVPAQESIIARWVSGHGRPRFSSLRSEEHTAQINKDLAKQIEDEFRANGINLLSSTTTFEMGINIGDLQKVLLRNAPPTSASYIQRIGRAGRGKEKNSVAVTLCRRTKYDADAWAAPGELLMSGEVRTPTVFIENKVLAQRHFNAVVFAAFLRIRLGEERSLGELKQTTYLEAFLPLGVREKIPKKWFKIQPLGVYLDFSSWLDELTSELVLRAEAGRSIAVPIGGFGSAKTATSTRYREIMSLLVDEVVALLKERQRLVDEGDPTADIERAIKDILQADVVNILAKHGFLPRYAFPLDVVTLETGSSRWSRDTDVELSRDRGIAIAEFGPGAQVIAHKKVFESAGLYIISKTDQPQKRWYSECRGCKQIRISMIDTTDSLKGSCIVCGKTINPAQDIRPFVIPSAFSVRIDRDTEGSARFRKNTLIRQRQSITHFIDMVPDSEFKNNGLFNLALKIDGALFRYNLGPKGEGFILCPKCGYSEPIITYRPGRRHKRLRAFGKTQECDATPWATGIAYGHRFQSFCLIARPTQNIGSVPSMAYALQKGLTEHLEIEASDIGVSWRRLSNEQQANRFEIVLYDNTPGGAGFVRDAATQWDKVVEKSLSICKRCNCLQACYNCLKTYSNQAHHDALDRNAVISALAYVVV